MEKRTLSCFKTYLIFVAAFMFSTAVNPEISAQIADHKPGDRVECEVTGNPNGKWWVKGPIQPFKDGDFGAGMEPDGSWYRFKADSNKVEYPCKPEILRPIAGAQPQNEPKQNNAPQPAEDESMPDTDYVECPIEQKKAANGARPNAELFKKIIRCKKGEKAVEAGDEGAVTVEISAIQIGPARPWRYSQDSGNAKPGTTVYPVKATYTIKLITAKQPKSKKAGSAFSISTSTHSVNGI